MSSPWPEEQFRIAIDHCAALLFAPTDLSAANLRRERVRGCIHVTGNTSMDAVLAALPALPPPAPRPRAGTQLLVTCHRRESWGEGLASIAAALREIAGNGIARIALVLHPNPAVAGDMRRLLGGIGGIDLRPPCSHGEMLRAMRDVDLILSDSGGMQEEAAVLGTPLLVLRQRTERPEAIATGNLELVGVDAACIVACVRRLLRDPAALQAMRRPTLVYGDGSSGTRIARITGEWLGGAPAQPVELPSSLRRHARN